MTTPIDEVFGPIIGRAAWQVRNGFGSFITMEFGDPRLEIREPQRIPEDASAVVKKEFRKRRVTVMGKWHFWIQYCDWRLRTTAGELTSNEDDKARVTAFLDELDGQILLSVKENQERATCEFQFDLGATLVLRPSPNFPDDDQWSVNFNGEMWAFYAASGTLTYGDREGNS